MSGFGRRVAHVIAYNKVLATTLQDDDPVDELHPRDGLDRHAFLMVQPKAGEVVTRSDVCELAAAAVLGPGSPSPWNRVALRATTGLAAVVMLGQGKFLCYPAIGIGLPEVALLSVEN